VAVDAVAETIALMRKPAEAEGSREPSG